MCHGAVCFGSRAEQMAGWPVWHPVWIFTLRKSFVVALFGYKTCGRSSPLNRTPCMCLEWSNLHQTFCIHWIISLPGFILKEHKWKSMALQIHWPNVSNNHIIDALPSSIIVTMKTYLCLWTVLLRFLKEAVSNSKVEGLPRLPRPWVSFPRVGRDVLDVSVFPLFIIFWWKLS